MSYPTISRRAKYSSANSTTFIPSTSPLPLTSLSFNTWRDDLNIRCQSSRVRHIHTRRHTRPNQYLCSASPAKKGKVSLVGVGSGSSEMLTLAGLSVLRSADVVLYDRLTDIEGLQARFKTVTRFEQVGKSGSSGTRQESINELIVRYAQSGLHVVRVKGGDVSIFGRLSDELHAARVNNIEVTVIPGVTSPSTVAAHLQFPLTIGGKGVCFVSGHEDTRWINGTLIEHVTLVVFMGLSNIHELLNRLNKDGGIESVSAVAVQDIMSDRERIVWGTVGTLSKRILDEGLQTPVLIFIGDVVQLAKDWPFDRKPGRVMSTK